MLVVSDTSPLSNLAIIGRLALLREQFTEVWMPPAVARELADLKNFPAQTGIAEAMHQGWLTEMPLPSTAPFPEIVYGLDAGETEVLRLKLTGIWVA